MARDKGVSAQTHQKHSRSWALWLEFLHKIKCVGDPYLDRLASHERLRICGAFMHVVRRGNFDKQRIKGVAIRSQLNAEQLSKKSLLGAGIYEAANFAATAPIDIKHTRLIRG